jgi:tyrosine-protein kinase
LNPDTPLAAAEQPQPGLQDYLRLLWRRKWVILACVVVLPIVVYLVSASAPKKYEAKTVIQVQAQSVNPALFTNESTPAQQSILATNRLIATTGVARRAAQQLHPPPANPASLLGQIVLDPDTEAGFITITASDSDPQRASDIANAFATSIGGTRARHARQQIDATIAHIQSDQQKLDRKDVDGRRQLSAQLQRLRALRAAQDNNIEIVEPATAAASPVSPTPRRNAILALIIAILIGIGLAFGLDRMDRTIRDPLDLEKLAEVPLLGIVPASAFPGEDSTSDVPEAFHTLRAGLTYFNVDRPLRTVLITSPLKGDGKTTIAVGLAAAVARGGKEVVLVDADLRHPQVAARVGANASAGLGDVLVGERPLAEALVDVPTNNGRLRILPGGPPPPNPSELVASDRMRSLLEELATEGDLVLLDSPPALVVSDAIPLFKEVSGVVVIGRVDETTRDAMRRLVNVIRTAGGTVLGVVATGARGSGLYGYGAYGGYASTDGASVSVNGARDTAAETIPERP